MATVLGRLRRTEGMLLRFGREALTALRDDDRVEGCLEVTPLCAPTRGLVLLPLRLVVARCEVTRGADLDFREARAVERLVDRDGRDAGRLLADLLDGRAREADFDRLGAVRAREREALLRDAVRPLRGRDFFARGGPEYASPATSTAARRVTNAMSFAFDLGLFRMVHPPASANEYRKKLFPLVK
ncbi:MAG: hypothetical protein JSU63_12835 [Phycisphaerales bacterium]|nr:MAG: hypothetical protein JSU63_12835 [Phycisphaerales bacterium]